MSRPLLEALYFGDDARIHAILDMNHNHLHGLPQPVWCCLNVWTCDNAHNYPLDWKLDNIVENALVGYQHRPSSKQLLAVLQRIKSQAGDAQFQSLAKRANIFLSRYEAIRMFLLENHAPMAIFADGDSLLTDSIRKCHVKVLRFLGQACDSWSSLLPEFELQKRRNVFWVVIRYVHAGTDSLLFTLAGVMKREDDLHARDIDGLCLVEYAELKRAELLRKERSAKWLDRSQQEGRWGPDDGTILTNRTKEVRRYLKRAVLFLITYCGASIGTRREPYIVECKQQYQQEVSRVLYATLPKDIAGITALFCNE